MVYHRQGIIAEAAEKKLRENPFLVNIEKQPGRDFPVPFFLLSNHQKKGGQTTKKRRSEQVLDFSLWRYCHDLMYPARSSREGQVPNNRTFRFNLHCFLKRYVSFPTSGSPMGLKNRKKQLAILPMQKPTCCPHHPLHPFSPKRFDQGGGKP